MLYDLKVTDLLKEIASDSPAPGGGSVSALAGALAASLVVMVGKLSAKGENGEKIDEIINSAEQLKNELQELMEKDTYAFNQVMTAYRMPKSTDEEKAKRSQAIQQGLKEAAIIPLTVMEKSLEVMELANEIAISGNQNAITDAGVAGLMANTAVKGAGYNVQINLLSIKDEDFKREIADKLNRLNVKAYELGNEIDEIVSKGIGV